MDQTIAHMQGRARLRALISGLALPALPLALPAAPLAATVEPIASRNLSPLYANLGVPVLRSARTPQRGEWLASYTLHWASHSVRVAGRGAALEFDGETQRHDLSLRVGITERLAIETNLPFVRHSAGHLDTLIDNWHALWGLPDGDRDDQPRDRLRFAYTAQPGFFLDESASGVGDAELGLSWRLLDGETAAITAFAQAKFATGDESRFTGSGATGYSAGARASFSACFFAALTCHAQLGIAEVGRISYAPGAEHAAAFASVALAWSLNDRLALIGQLDAHGVVYDSGPLDAEGAPLWGSLGLRWSFADAWTMEAEFSEDLAVGAAPDITFMVGMARRF